MAGYIKEHTCYGKCNYAVKEIRQSDYKNPKNYIAHRHELYLMLKDEPGNFHQWTNWANPKNNKKRYVMLVKGWYNECGIRKETP